jgi:hypothetical protein
VLITVEELETYTQKTFASEQSQLIAQDAIASASSVVETHCRRQFGLVSDDSISVRWRPSIVLPNPPVVSVWSFAVDGVASDYDIDLSGRYWPRATGDQITVVYTHGFDPVQETVKLVVRRLASRIVENPSLRTSYTGPDGLTYSSSADLGPKILTGDEMAALRRFVLHKAI